LFDARRNRLVTQRRTNEPAFEIFEIWIQQLRSMNARQSKYDQRDTGYSHKTGIITDSKDKCGLFGQGN
jgi:hypothetical protein